MVESDSSSTQTPLTFSRPDKAQTVITQTAQGTEFSIRIAPRGTPFFMCIWLAGWTVGCVALAYQCIYHFKIQLFLGGLAFWISWIFVASMMRSLLFGRQLLIISPGGITFTANTTKPKKFVACALNRVQSVQVEEWVIREEHSSRQGFGVRIENDQSPMVFGKSGWNQTLTQEEANWLCQEIQVSLGLHGGDAVLQRVVLGEETSAPGNENFTEEELRGPRVGRFFLTDTLDGARIDRPADWSLQNMAGATFIMLFWNAIVSIFLFEIYKGNAPWGIGIFLIPFVLIGVLLIGVWFFTLVSLFIGQVWFFYANHVEYHKKMLGIPWRKKVFENTKIAIAQQQPTPENKLNGLTFQNTNAEKTLKDQRIEKGQWSLALLDDQGQSVMTIPLLRPIELAAITRLLRSRQPRWFE